MLPIFVYPLRRSWVVVLIVCHVGDSGFPLLLCLLLGYHLLLQDFPLLHPDSLLQGAQKGYLMGLGRLALPLHRVVPILLLWLFQRMKIRGPLGVAVLES